jgi:hypothetical protein
MGWRPVRMRLLLATTAAWAVFGAARRWFQTPNRIPAEEMAARIETMVSRSFSVPLNSRTVAI